MFMQHFRSLSSGCAMLALIAAGCATSAEAAVSFTAVSAGETDSSTAIVWTHVEGAAAAVPLKLYVSRDPSFATWGQKLSVTADPANDYTAKMTVKGLASAQTYYYRFVGPNGPSMTGVLHTAPKPTFANRSVTFAFSGDADGQWRPYSSIKGIANANLDFFVFLGDVIYETANAKSAGTADPFANPTQALTDYRRKYLENLQPVTAGGFPSLQELFTGQAHYTLLDNHELGNKQFINGGAPQGSPAGAGVDAKNAANDVNTTGQFMNKTPGFQALMQAYIDYHAVSQPILSTPSDPRTDGTRQMFYSRQWGKNVTFINLDDRSYRDIRMKNATGDETGARADNPNRTMLGATQLDWLKHQLDGNPSKWKVIALSSPIDENGGDGGKSWAGGYRAERNDLLKFIADKGIKNVVFLSTDDHQNRINEITYFPNYPDKTTRKVIPGVFTIVAGPIGAGGPDTITDHSFANIKSLADSFAAGQNGAGLEPIGLDPAYPGLHDVFREGDADADKNRSAVDFYSPDTFNYVILNVSADGKTLSVDSYGINSYASNTFPEPDAVNNPVRHILGFKLDAQK